MDKTRKIRVIPITKTRASKPLYDEKQKIKVCAYARVSTEQEEQQSSYEAQIKHYTDYITKNEDWEFVGVYADEGISGTSTKHRVEFNRMIEDAKNGKIDLILTKSISRFARNTLDTIRITRELKALGVEVYFEKENLKSMNPETEITLTILSSLAQDESRSLSQNVSWGLERRMRKGKFTIAWSNFLGYDKGPDGLPVINKEEAKIIRTIYDLYLSGKTSGYIAKYLEEHNIPSPRGKKTWSTATVLSILKNEKYKGDARIHKTFTVDYLSKKVKKNEGEVSQYYVYNSHPAIIEPEVFDLVQEIIISRAKKTGSRNNKYAFNSKLYCEKCGEVYTRKTKEQRAKEHISWNCYAKYDYKRLPEKRCNTKPAYEPEIINGYMSALKQLYMQKGKLISQYTEKITELRSPDVKKKLEGKVQTLQNKLNKMHAGDIEYMKKISKELKYTEQVLHNNNVELAQLEKMKQTLETLQEITYTDELFSNTINRIMVNDNYFIYCFYGGEKVKITRSEKRGAYDEIIE